MFGTRLKRLREEKQLTQQQLADILKVGRPTIAGYETKSKEPDFEKLIFLSNLFDVSIDYLLGSTSDRHSTESKSPESDPDNWVVLAKELGFRIKELRIEQKLSQLELAKILNISNTTLSQYETGQRVPSDEIKIKMSSFFDVSLDYLLGTTNDRHGTSTKKGLLANEQGDRIIQHALKGTGLLSADGTLSAEGEDVISSFLKNNAEILKKLIKEDD